MYMLPLIIVAVVQMLGLVIVTAMKEKTKRQRKGN